MTSRIARSLRPLIVALAALAAVLLPGCARQGDPTQSRSSVDSSRSAAYPRSVTVPGLATGPTATPAIPGSLPALDEEVWIIVQDEAAAGRADPDQDAPGTGAMVCRRIADSEAGDTTEIPLPLEHTSVETSITAYIAAVNVKQTFQNPYDGKIEALYVFPLPQNAAVNGFVMSIGERRIRGIIREREEARQLYDQAKRAGHVASLLTQERANIFTQAVANLEPGARIDIDITYFHTLAYRDGWYEYTFPMVVGPRFNPPGSTSGVGAIARGNAGASGQSTEVQYLRPGERSGHDIDLRVTIDAGVQVEEVICHSHAVATTHAQSAHAVVELSRNDTIPNRDFVLRYRVAGDTIKAGLLAHRTNTGGYFSLMLYPPAALRDLPRDPVEMVFVVDCSGSMRGEPLDQAKRAMRRALRGMDERDAFQIVRFSDRSSAMGRRPLPATPQNVRRGLDYVDDLQANGGTMMINGIRAALETPRDPQRRRYVTFMTDGYIGNEREVLGAVHQHLGDARLFSFGIGSAPNRYLMNRMAKLGQGAVAYLGLNDSAADVMDHYLERISHPALADITIDWGGLGAFDVFPRRVPDLFVGRPVIVLGRFKGAADAAVRLQGSIGGRRVERALTGGTRDRVQTHDALAAVWGRTQIADLMDQRTDDNDVELPDRIRDLALALGLMSQWTAFVAVDSSRTTQGAEGTTVAVAVPVPEGVKYETTVSETPTPIGVARDEGPRRRN